MELVKETRDFEKKAIVTKEGISIFLENQEEIDELYAILNFVPTLDALESDFVNSLHDALSAHKAGGYTVFHDKLHKGLTWKKGGIRCQE